MCEPITIATAIGLGISTIGGMSSAYGQHRQGQDQKNIDLDNAMLADIAAKDALIRGDREANMVREQGRQVLGAQHVAVGSSGVDSSVGSPVDLMSSTAALAELDALTVKNNAAREAWGLKTQSTQLVQQAANDAARGTAAGGATFLSTVGSTITGATNLYRVYKQNNPGESDGYAAPGSAIPSVRVWKPQKTLAGSRRVL